MDMCVDIRCYFAFALHWLVLQQHQHSLI